MRVTLRITWLLLLPSMVSPSDEETSAPVTLKTSGPTVTAVASVEGSATTVGLMATTKKTVSTLVAEAQTSTIATKASTNTNKASQNPTTTVSLVTVTTGSTPTAAEKTIPGPAQATTTHMSVSPAPTAGETKVLPSPNITVSKPQTTRQTPGPAGSSSWASTAPTPTPTQGFTVFSTNKDNQGTTANSPTDAASVQPMLEKSTQSALPASHAPPAGHTTVTITTQGLTSTPAMSAKNPGVTFRTSIQTKTEPTPVRTTAGASLQETPPTTAVQPRKFTYPLLSGQETKEEKDLVTVCQKLMPDWQNLTCTLTWRRHNGRVHFDSVEINGKVNTSLASKYYEEITKKEEEQHLNPTNYNTLIAILASCGALLIMIIILTVCASHHRKPSNENQQYLTEELHTVENYYHDNPTLEVMEVQPEMQEKKMVLNGEFNDSWIVPIDNLMKEDLPDEEDTHL